MQELKRWGVWGRVRVACLSACVWAGVASPAAAQDEVEPGVAGTLSLVPKAQTNVAVVGDLWVPTRALLASPAFERFMREGAWAQLVIEVSEGEIDRSMLDPQVWLEEIESNGYQLFVPSGLALAADDATMSLFGLAMEGFVSGSLTMGSVQAGDDASAAELRGALVEAIERVESPRATILVRFRNPATAGQLLGMAMMFSQQAQNEGAPLQVADGMVSAFFDVGQMVPREVLMGQMEDSGLFGPGDEALMGRAADALMRVKLGLRMAQVGDALVISVTPDLGELEGDVAGLAAPALLAEATGPVLAYSRGSVAPLVASIERAAALTREFRGTPAWDAIMETEVATFLSQPESLLLSLRQVGDGVESVAWLDQGVRGVTLVTNPGEALDLAASGWLNKLPAGAAGVQVDGTTSGGQALADTLKSMDDRTMAMQIFTSQAMWGDGPSVEEQMAEYDEKTAVLRDLLLEKAPAVFAAPTFAVWDGQGEFKELGFTVTRDGQEQGRIEVPPVAGGPEFLVGFAVAEGQDAAEWVRAVVAESIKVGEAIAGEDVPDGAGALIEVDLVPGVKAYQYDLTWLRTLAAEDGAAFELKVDGDFNPHLADLGSVVVFSTSPRLTLALSESMSGVGEGVEVPRVDGALVSYSKSDLAPFTDSLVNLGLSVERLSVWDEGELEQGEEFLQGRRIAGRVIVGLAEFLSLVESGEMVGYDKDGVRRVEMWIKAAE